MDNRNHTSENIEVIRPVQIGRNFKAALFDFDGTLSLIREGWQEVMTPYFCEEFYNSVSSPEESEDKVYSLIKGFIDELTGKQTIFQCIQLKLEIEKRGGKAKDAMEYKTEYLNRLYKKIESRKKGLCDESIKPEELLVSGTVSFLTALKETGVVLYCASGTDQPQVREEARLLGLDRFFDGNIYGALDAHAEQCSKEVVIKDLLHNHSIKGEELLSFGDGFVEIELVKNVGGYAVAVATDEKNKCGVDKDKRLRLLSAGADAVIPDFNCSEELIKLIFNKK